MNEGLSPPVAAGDRVAAHCGATASPTGRRQRLRRDTPNARLAKSSFRLRKRTHFASLRSNNFFAGACTSLSKAAFSEMRLRRRLRPSALCVGEFVKGRQPCDDLSRGEIDNAPK